MTDYVWEIWRDFYDGTQANKNGKQERVAVFLNQLEAAKHIEKLNADDKEKPFYLVKVPVFEAERFAIDETCKFGQLYDNADKRHLSIVDSMQLLNAMDREIQRQKKEIRGLHNAIENKGKKIADLQEQLSVWKSFITVLENMRMIEVEIPVDD